MSYSYNNQHSFEFCNACQQEKLHKFHFSTSEIRTKQPLELIHTDLWGPASVMSMNGYKYYVSFVDDYTRYNWIFPLVLKSDALKTFKTFKRLVEKQFNMPIKTLQSVMGREFRIFHTFLQQEGIQSRFSCPHSYHQNGVVERKHRHIVETSLTLLTQANMPLSFWWEAFHTASFLINRMPTSVLNNVSPFQKLHHQLPDYQFLKVFGYACYLLLKPYNSHKLNFHSKKCLFLGYSPLHKSYKCLYKLRRIYIAIHVQFNEYEFPYSEMFSPSSFSQSSVDQSLFSSPLCTIYNNSSYQSPVALPCSAVLPTPGSSASNQHQEQPSPSRS